MLILGIVVGAVLILLTRELAFRATLLFLKFSVGVPATLNASQVWTRSQTLRSQFSSRCPALFRFLRERVDPQLFIGLPLTLTIVAALYLVALFSGLTEEILDAEGIVRFDGFVNTRLQPWRVEPLVSIFFFITALGSSSCIIAAAIVATVILSSRARYPMIAALWATSLGAVLTTSIGKFLIGRHRPDSTLDVAAAFSSFPSGHATAAMAVYGFLAFVISRGLSTMRKRFEVTYWTAVLIGMIGLSRIVLGVHYATDVVGGFLIGGFWLLIGFTIAEWTQPIAPPPKPRKNL